MAVGGAKAVPALGFLTVLEHPQHGLFGGYLLLNLAGRPLEFHCTAPLKANRAQQILYGPTLQPFLYGEQIGQTLIQKGSLQPLAVCTDQAPALAVREHVDMPVVLVVAQDTTELGQGAASDTTFRVDASHRLPDRHFFLGRNRLVVTQAHQEDEARIGERLSDLPESFDLFEPFGRIREALEEAQRSGK